MDIENSSGGTWTLNDFGAFGPVIPGGGVKQSVYMFTKAEARRILKKGYGRVEYTTLRVGTFASYFAGRQSTYVIIKARSIRFGCQVWKGRNATAFRKWAFSK